MNGRLVDLLINDFNRRYFDVMTPFRFHLDYVNLLSSHIYWALLQSLLFGGLTVLGVISCLH